MPLFSDRGDVWFACDAVRFRLMSEVADGIFHWVVEGKNESSVPSTLIVSLSAPSSLTFQMQLDCPGKSSCRERYPVTIPVEHQGSTECFEIFADVDYPKGNGAAASPAEGISLPSRHSQAAELWQVRTSPLSMVTKKPMLEVTFPTNLTAAPDSEDAPLSPIVRFVVVVIVTLLLLAFVAVVLGDLFGL